MARRFQTLPGFREFYPEDCAARNHVFDVWREVARRYGFVEYEGPVLEPTDLYRHKSGEEIVNQLFCFEDKGERDVSLRPELTPTLARMAAARQREFRKPLRWFSIGQFFRYEKHQKGRGREFYQFNCDILGESSPLADAELAALSIDMMRAFGFGAEHFRIRLSDRDAWVTFAEEKGVTGDSVETFLQAVDRMERAPPEKTGEQLQALGVSLDEVRAFIDAGATGRSGALGEILGNLEARGMGDFVEVDLGIVRGLAYYTGPVFEVFDIGRGMRALAGGGRYDRLVERIGGVDMPACGFAVGDMVITDLIRETEEPARRLEAAVQSDRAIDTYVIVADESRTADAFRVAQALRAAGRRVAAPFTSAKVGKQFQAAEQLGARFAVVVGGEYPEVRIKDLPARTETVGRADTIEADLEAASAETA